MGELTVTSFVSLDGVMQAPGGPNEDTSGNFTFGGWLVPFADADMGEEIDRIFSKAEAFLLGRGTYDIFSAHWPKVSDENDVVALKLNSLPKYVVSNKTTQFAWNNTHHVPKLVDGVANLKKKLTGELQVHGSPGLLQGLIRENLIDEFRLFVFPVVLGVGKRLFGPGTGPRSLSLVGTKTTSTGTVIATYRRGGEFQPGSFELK